MAPKALFDEISALFDLNFSGLLRSYTDTIYQKDQEIERNVKLLEQYKKAIDESAIVAITDAQGVITYVNAKLGRACGYEEGELIGNSHNIMHHPDMPPQFFKAMWETIHSGKSFRGTIKNRRKNGQSFYVDTTIVPMTDTTGSIVEYMAISYEVTDLVVAREEAIEAGRAKEDFLSCMSHEIRTPLNAILGFVELLCEVPHSAKEQRYLDIIYSSGENLLGIINDILDVSKLRSGEFAIEPRPFNLHKTIAHTLELFVPGAQHKQLILSSFIDPDIPYELIADPLRIQQIISNLLSNAIKFTPPGGEIHVEASYKQGQIGVSVNDTGIGISMKDQEHIFDPFSQAHRLGNVERGGTGLGLAISAQLVNHMGGEITVVSRPGLGSTFQFTIPVQPGGESVTTLLEPTLLKERRVAMLTSKHGMLHEPLRRYFERFSLKLERVTSVDAKYDLLFFDDTNIDTHQRQAIVDDPRPSIALQQASNTFYDDAMSVIPMVMPLYCSKLQEAIENAFDAHCASSIDAHPSLRACRRGRILVAEDNEANQELMRTLLDNLDISYDMVGDGYAALTHFKTEKYSLVLMDEQMPIMNGHESALKMLEHEKRFKIEHTPVIALSANVMGRKRDDSIYDDFIGKPVRMQTFRAYLDKYLDLRIQHACEPLQSDEEESQEYSREGLCSILEVNEQQLQMLLEVYVRKMRELLPKLHATIVAGDLNDTALVAHAIKGSSSNFRLTSVSEIAELIERKAKAKESGELIEPFESMQAAFEAFVDVTGM